MRVYRPSENVEEVLDMRHIMMADSYQLVLVKQKKKMNSSSSSPLFVLIDLVVIDPVE